MIKISYNVFKKLTIKKKKKNKQRKILNCQKNVSFFALISGRDHPVKQ